MNNKSTVSLAYVLFSCGLNAAAAYLGMIMFQIVSCDYNRVSAIASTNPMLSPVGSIVRVGNDGKASKFFAHQIHTRVAMFILDYLSIRMMTLYFSTTTTLGLAVSQRVASHVTDGSTRTLALPPVPSFFSPGKFKDSPVVKGLICYVFHALRSQIEPLGRPIAQVAKPVQSPAERW